jgi:nucleoside-diphosphate-sugar epimerase
MSVLGARASNPSEPASITAAVERLHDEVGRRGGRTLEQGTAETIAWWREAVPAP